MQLLVGLTLIGLLILCVTALFHIKSTMLEDRKQKTLNLIESAQGVLTYHQKLVADGKLSQGDAKKSAKEVLRAIEVADVTREQRTASASISQRVEQITNMLEETTVTIRATSATAQELEGVLNRRPPVFSSRML